MQFVREAIAALWCLQSRPATGMAGAPPPRPPTYTLTAVVPAVLCRVPAPVEVPAGCSVGYLKRTICRALGGNLWPVVLREPATGNVLEERPTDNTLASYGISNNALVHMVRGRVWA